VGSAVDGFRSMMRDHVAPALRAMGFVGSGRSYVLPSDTHWVLLGFQKSRSSDAAAVPFTVNVTVASKEAWAAMRRTRGYLPERPSANTFYGPEIWRRRIGMLLPEGADRWWTLTPATPAAALAAEVVDALRLAALPEIRRRLAGEE
jgi:uncharacterized protein DUF4304